MKANNNIFLESAMAIGMDLVKTSIWHENKCNWLGYWIEHLDGKYQTLTRSFGPDIYSGTSGIALFLAALYSETGDKLLHKTVIGAVEQIKSTMHNVHDHGFYSGKAGIAFSMVKIGILMERADWINEGVALIKDLKLTDIQLHETDVISGIAGTIPVLIDFYKEFSNPRFAEMATKLGVILCGKADKDNDQWSWKTVPAHKNLTGYSHGAAGISNSLLQVYSVTNNPMFRDGALMGFNYEQHQFDHAQQNWPDYREGATNITTGKYNCGIAWCHGAPGIALSRLDANRTMPASAFKTQAQTALHTTGVSVAGALNNALTGSNFSLCHGVAGNADVLLESGQEEYVELAEMIGTAGVEKYENKKQPWPSGLNTSQQTPGIMMGASGTGYFYLRLYNPNKFKTILLPKL